MIAGAGAFLLHLRIRLCWVVRDPVALAVMLLSATATLLLWPGRELPATSAATFSSASWLLWLYLWPALPAIYAAGRSSGGADSALFLRWSPALPIGARTRAAADAVVVLLFVFPAHAVAALIGGRPLLETLTAAALGAVVMLPSLLAWTVPAGSFNLYMFRPLAAAALTLAVVSAAWPASPQRALLVCGGLALLVLSQAGREPHLPRWLRRRRRQVRWWRPALDPQRRLRRDVWGLSGRRFGPWLGLAAAALVAAVALHRPLHLPRYSVLVAAEAVIIILIVAAVKPFGSPLIVAGLAGRFGARMGDFVRAWSVLPVRRERVLRGVWLYCAGVTAAAWFAGIAVILALSLHRGDGLSLVDGDGGGLAPVVLPFAALVLTLPAFLVAAAVGHKAHTIVAGVISAFVVHGHVMLLAALSTALPRGSALPPLIDAAAVAGLTLIGGLPPLVHLRPPRAP